MMPLDHQMTLQHFQEIFLGQALDHLKLAQSQPIPSSVAPLVSNSKAVTVYNIYNTNSPDCSFACQTVPKAEFPLQNNLTIEILMPQNSYELFEFYLSTSQSQV